MNNLNEMQKTFGNNLRRLLKKNGISRQQLADELGIAYSTVANWINGQRFASQEHMLKLTKLLNVDYLDLTEDYDKRQRFLEVKMKELEYQELNSQKIKKFNVSVNIGDRKSSLTLTHVVPAALNELSVEAFLLRDNSMNKVFPLDSLVFYDTAQSPKDQDYIFIWYKNKGYIRKFNQFPIERGISLSYEEGFEDITINFSEMMLFPVLWYCSSSELKHDIRYLDESNENQ